MIYAECDWRDLLGRSLLQESLPVVFSLLGIGCGEVGDGLVEARGGADVACDDARVAGAGVTARQRFSADCGILQQAVSLQLGHLNCGFMVVELTNQEVAALDGGPTEEGVGLELHSTLAIDDAAALMRRHWRLLQIGYVGGARFLLDL